MGTELPADTLTNKLRAPKRTEIKCKNSEKVQRIRAPCLNEMEKATIEDSI